VGFADNNTENLKRATEAWNSAPWYLPHENLGNEEFYSKVDIAVVATPDDAHYDILKQLANYPLKLVICEKPLCTDLAQAREIVVLYKAKGTPLMVNYTRRFIPELQELKRRYEAGEFGRLVAATHGFNRGILHTGTHIIDFYHWMFGEYVKINELSELHVDYRVWHIQLLFEKYFWQEQRIGDMPVPAYFDRHMWHLAENAFAFLEGKEPLRCTGADALKTLEICFGLMEGAKEDV